MEIRLHGRGGQGGVTCAKILAALYARQGKSVQTFGDYAGERSGAPVRAYTRVSDAPITNRNKVYHPDRLLVLDPTLLGDEVLSGMQPGGDLLLNTPQGLDAFADRFTGVRLGVVDATEIARRHGIGTQTVVIVNTTIAGAYAKLNGIPLSDVEQTYAALGFQSNFPAAREAYDAVALRDVVTASDVEPDEAPTGAPVPPLVTHYEGAPPPLKTGSWRQQEPRYVDHLAPCNAWCPAGNDVIGFVQAVARDGEQAASQVLGRTTPLAAVCGRVCPAPCMEGCNRAEYDGSVNIRGLERRIADTAPVAEATRATPAKAHRIAIVGSGPAGLSAAYELARAGHAVTIYEGEAQLGGVLRTGIPTFRLEREVLDREVEAILALGVEARTGEFLDHDALERLVEDHDGVIVATGLQRLRKLSAPGVDLSGVEQGIRYLHRVNLKGPEAGALSGRVVVLGGGNTAIDCARAALRAGADPVVLAYRRSRTEMPAIKEEIEEAVEEGVELRLLRQPVAFHGDGRVEAVELAEVELGEPDASGRRRPVVTDRTERVPCDAVLLALGQSADMSLLPDGWRLDDDRLFAGDRELACFAAGDLTTGDGTVTHAIGHGRRIAGRLLQALGEDVTPFARRAKADAVPATDIRFDHFARSAPSADRHAPVDRRRAGFESVNLGLPDALEAHRCFSCGHCTQCDTCLVYCPEGSLHRLAKGYQVDYSYCKGCGICVSECPRKAMEMVSL